MIVTILPRIRPVLIFDSLEYRMPVAWISFIAFAPRYQAMAPKRLKKMPMMPKIKISVPCGCSGGAAPYC